MEARTVKTQQLNEKAVLEKHKGVRPGLPHIRVGSLSTAELGSFVFGWMGLDIADPAGNDTVLHKFFLYKDLG